MAEVMTTPINPRDWTQTRKWAQILTVASFTMLAPLSSALPAPAAPNIARDLDMTSSLEMAMIVSVFVLGFAFGPLILAPLCEVYGRAPVLQLSNLFFFVFNLACGFVNNKAELLTFRFLAGLGGSGPLAIGAAVIADCFAPADRNTALALYSLGPVLGPAIGPVVGGFVATYTTWRWIFWSSSALCAAVAVCAFFLLRESHYQVLVRRASQQHLRVKPSQGSDESALSSAPPHTGPAPAPVRTLEVLKKGMVRPFVLLLTQPIVIFLSIYVGFVYGLVYLVITTFSTIYTSPEFYNETIAISGLHFIALAIGFFVGAQIRAPVGNYLYMRLKARAGGVDKPEFRIPAILPGAVLVPLGLFWFGWAAQARAPWIVTDLGAAFFTAGIMIAIQSITGYIIDAYTVNAASAMAATTCLRSLLGFGLPLAAPYMYAALGVGWGNSLLGFLSIALGIPAPLLLWFYGERLRKMSSYAASPEEEGDSRT